MVKGQWVKGQVARGKGQGARALGASAKWQAPRVMGQGVRAKGQWPRELWQAQLIKVTSICYERDQATFYFDIQQTVGLGLRLETLNKDQLHHKRLAYTIHTT